MAVWAAVFAGRRRGGRILGALSLLVLLVGGGFVPVFIGLVAAATASRLNTPFGPGGAGWRIFSGLWPWPLALMAIWLPGSWLLGYFFGEAMLAAGGLLLLCFDIALPLLAAISAFAQDKHKKEDL
jgi:hypothetical protein